MKIFVLTYLYPNSEYPNHGIFVHNRIKAVSNEVEVIVVNPIPWSPLYYIFNHYKRYKKIPLEETIDGVKVYHPRFLSIPKVLKIIEVLSYKYSVIKLIKEKLAVEKYDIIDLHWTFPDLPTGTYLKKRYAAKLITTIRGNEALHLNENNFSEKCVKEQLINTDGLIGVSESLKDLSSRYAVNAQVITVIRNGVDTERFYYIDRNECRNKLGISINDKVIFSVGSIIYRKGFDLIINALYELKKNDGFGNLHLYIGGSAGHEGDYQKQLDKLINQLDLTDSVIFIGQIENADLVSWYNAADIFCLASRGEGSPNVLTEALACGCPSIVSDVGASREVIESESDQGICVPVDDSASIQKAVVNLLSVSSDRKALSNNFRKYTWAWCGKKVIEVYKELLKD